MRLVRQLRSPWPRRVLATGCLLIAAMSALHSTRPAAKAADATTRVVIAARPLAAGAVLTGDSVRLAQWPVALAPASAIADPTALLGRRLADAVAAGEPVTSTRLVGNDLSTGLSPGLIAAPVPLVDSGAAGLIHAGDHVDLLSPPSDPSRPATMVAADVLVLAVIPGDPAGGGSSAQMVVAVDAAAELRIAQVITTPLLATLIKPP